MDGYIISDLEIDRRDVIHTDKPYTLSNDRMVYNEKRNEIYYTRDRVYRYDLTTNVESALELSLRLVMTGNEMLQLSLCGEYILIVTESNNFVLYELTLNKTLTSGISKNSIGFSKDRFYIVGDDGKYYMQSGISRTTLYHYNLHSSTNHYTVLHTIHCPYNCFYIFEKEIALQRYTINENQDKVYLRVWDLTKNECLGLIYTGSHCRDVKGVPNKDIIIVQHHNFNMSAYNLRTREKIWARTGRLGFTLHFISHGDVVVKEEIGGRLIAYNTDDGKTLWVYNIPEYGDASSRVSCGEQYIFVHRFEYRNVGILLRNPNYRWSPTVHRYHTERKKEEVRTLFTMNVIDDCILNTLPKEVLTMICEL